ncbi:hypothetical protein GF314_03570 [bacterium]|nr:hypothetical protein [bacterium]
MAPDDQRPPASATDPVDLPRALADPCRRIQEQLTLLSPRAEAVAASLDELDGALATAPASAWNEAVCLRLADLLRTRRDTCADLVARWLVARLPMVPDPDRLAQVLLAGRDADRQRTVVRTVLGTWSPDSCPMSTELIGRLAEATGAACPPDRDDPDLRALLDEVATRLGHEVDPDAADPREALLCTGPTTEARRLAARALDLAGLPVPESRLARALGVDAADRLGGLLQYSRATHQDLVDLTPTGRLADGLVDQLVEAGQALGPAALGAIVGELGWAAVCRGVAVERRLGVSVDGSFPFLATPEEADLLEAGGRTRRLFDRHLVVAHGGAAAATGDTDPATAEVARFRRYNLLHADLLGEILEIAPLTPAKLERVVASLDEVVELFSDLFAADLDHPGQVRERYRRLKAPLVDAVDTPGRDQPLDAETTRLVLMFEDPRTVDEVTTLHGLKRYLHQRGLQLAFQRFRSGQAANRTVDLAVVAGDRVVQTLRKIRYIDFEPADDPGALPFVVSLVVEALGRRLLHLLADAPDVELLIYGNEVQAFVRFRNHPAFLRIDSSPPLRGGMIDLVYFGVSQYELDHHPDLNLPWIQRVFQRLDFDAGADGLQLHIRYDKERAFDLGDLIEHVRLLCSLLPHLMDLDWVLGGLRYPEPVQAAIADHWADWILRWGVLPDTAMLTRDRRALLQEVRSDAAGSTAVPWDGRGEVRHHLAHGPGPEFWTRLQEALASDEAAATVCWAAAREAPRAQLPLQDLVLDPRREARARVASGVRAPADAPMRFAGLLATGGGALGEAARMASVVESVERHLRFATVGTIHGHPVRQASLMLPGEVLDIQTLHDASGAVRLASARTRPFLLTPGCAVPGRVEGPTVTELDAASVAARLRRGNYVGITCEVPRPPDAVDLADLAATFAEENPHAPPVVEPGERTLDGVTAAPGRAAGTAVFYRPDLTPADVAECVLFAPALRPEDTPLLRRAAAVVSTGGGILSHAGMIALELGKPALVVQGTWQLGEARRAALVCRTTDYSAETMRHGERTVTVYRDRREREEHLREGDLVVVDAGRGKLGILGQDRDALAMQEELRHHDTVAASLDGASPGQQELTLRGGLLRAAHQLQKLVGRIDQPNLARHAARELLAPGRRGFADADERTPAGSRRSDLLRRLFANEQCGEVARRAAEAEAAGLAQQLRARCAGSLRAVPAAETVHEVVYLQQSVEHDVARLEAMTRTLAAAGLAVTAGRPDGCGDLETACRSRLITLRERCMSLLADRADHPQEWWRARNALQVHATLDELLGDAGGESREQRQRADAAVRARKQRSLARLSERRIVRCTDGGLELARLIGAKGAHLGEIARVLGPERVPSWFAVSDTGFREALAAPIGPVDASLRLAPGTPVLLAVQDLLARGDLDTAARAAAIAAVWRSLVLPDGLAREIRTAYAELAAQQPADPAEPSVAVRSSTFEEDGTRSSWAGQFDTFLGVRGAESVLTHVKLAWASLWSERVLHHRRDLASGGDAGPPGGGVLVQRLVDSRAAGVAHTLSPVSGQPREMVVNVGLGLGEGVVSGTVEVDQISIIRTAGEMPETLRFRYTVGDKRHQVVYDRRRGGGTCIEETLYHQRLRPALEYADLEDLVRAATRLETALGHPLDVEFALAADRLFILQARPIVAYQAALAAARRERDGAFR